MCRSESEISQNYPLIYGCKIKSLCYNLVRQAAMEKSKPMPRVQRGAGWWEALEGLAEFRS